MKQIWLLPVILSLTSLLPSGAYGIVYIDEAFETLGVPSNPAQINAVQVTNAAGSPIGTGNAAHFTDVISGSGGGGDLEYNVGGSALGMMYIQFDLLNNAPDNTGTAANPIIFGVGPWSTTSGTSLGANANRAFGVEFYQTGSSSTLKIRTNGTAPLSVTYDMSAVQTVKIWVNDNDSSTMSYTRPDNSTSATLDANSFVVWINNTLVGSETVTGIGMNTGAVAGNTTGDATLGRLGFNTSTTTLADFWIDNLYVADSAPVIPEPSAIALIASGSLLILLQSYRRRARV